MLPNGVGSLAFSNDEEAAFYDVTIHGPRQPGGPPNVIHAERTRDDLVIRDESGDARVHLEHARVHTPDRSVDHLTRVEADTPFAAYLDALEIEAPGTFVDRSVELRYRWLAPGDEVVVVGEATPPNNDDNDTEGDGDGVAVVFNTTSGFQLEVVGTSLDEYKRDQLSAGKAMARTGWTLMLLGAVLAAAGAAFALS